MTAFAKAQLPDSVNTVERLAIWAISVMQAAANGRTVAAVAGQGDTPAASVQFGTLADGQTYFLGTIYARAGAQDALSGVSKPYLAAMEISNNTIPAAFTTP
jgi:hypothetical protein